MNEKRKILIIAFTLQSIVSIKKEKNRLLPLQSIGRKKEKYWFLLSDISEWIRNGKNWFLLLKVLYEQRKRNIDYSQKHWSKKESEISIIAFKRYWAKEGEILIITFESIREKIKYW